MPGSNPYWFAIQILGVVDAVEKVEISKDASSWTSLRAMGESATWVLGSGAEKIVGVGRTVSVRVTEVAQAGQQLVLQLVNVIPAKWSAGTTYEYTRSRWEDLREYRQLHATHRR
ncbi:hypothetical protein CLOP_g12071 [Closterium sp. NIES-67]|nr:hypothetical protein CLOP_g12071 [Closterium sp. NIES-67]